jgi:Cu-processing system permease protein
VSSVMTIAGYALRESLRRRVFLVVLVLTVGFLGLYTLGAIRAFEDTRNFAGRTSLLDAKVITGSTIFGLAMFATLFLGTVLAVFLTLGVVRGDAESGLLQPLVVRPLGRPALLAGRFVAAVAVCAGYVLVVYFAAFVITDAAGDWHPDRVVTPGLALAGAVTIVVALSLLGSVYLSTTANGIAIFMVFGAGLTAGLLGQIGRFIHSNTLEDVGNATTWVFPFDALYEHGLHLLIADTGGIAGFALTLGPFGGAHAGGPLLGPWALVYAVAVGALTVRGFQRQDL